MVCLYLMGNHLKFTFTSQRQDFIPEGALSSYINISSHLKDFSAVLGRVSICNYIHPFIVALLRSLSCSCNADITQLRYVVNSLFILERGSIMHDLLIECIIRCWVEVICFWRLFPILWKLFSGKDSDSDKPFRCFFEMMKF